MPDDERILWYAVRGRRTSMEARSKLNTTVRRKTFAAALAQFEEQYAAAKVVTAMTRPLNLYYGLAQAGMAIASARADDPWSFNRHGLRLDRNQCDLADMTVVPDGTGGFQKVARTTGSPLIAGPVRLGALWASLPDLSGAGPLPAPGPDTPLPIPLIETERSPYWPTATIFLPTGVLSRDLPAASSSWRERFAEIMKGFPSATGMQVPSESMLTQPAEDENWKVYVAWPRTQTPPQRMTAQERKTFTDAVAPPYRYQQDRFLRPAIDADGTVAPSPLMTWWLLLYSFSILARYEPRKWSDLLDVDKSRAAVTLQYALDEALTAVPQLVVEALDGQPFLFSKPLSWLSARYLVHASLPGAGQRKLCSRHFFLVECPCYPVVGVLGELEMDLSVRQ